MAEKAPPHQTPDQNVLVYVSEYQNVALQTTVSSRKPVFYRNYDGVACDNSVRTTPETMVCLSSAPAEPTSVTDNDNSSEFKPDSIAPPFGWKRLLSNGIIIYVSPSNTALSSLDQVRSYLLTDGTCKCGLECPLHISHTFSFDPKVITKPSLPPSLGTGDLTKLCNHKRKLLSSLENTNGDPRFAGLDSLRKKKRRLVVAGSIPASVLQNRLTPPLAPPRQPTPVQQLVKQVPQQENLQIPQQTTLQPHQQQVLPPQQQTLSQLPGSNVVWRDDSFMNGYGEYGSVGLSGQVGLEAANNGIPELHPVQGTLLPDGILQDPTILLGQSPPDPYLSMQQQVHSGPMMQQPNQSIPLSNQTLIPAQSMPNQGLAPQSMQQVNQPVPRAMSQVMSQAMPQNPIPSPGLSQPVHAGVQTTRRSQYPPNVQPPLAPPPYQVQQQQVQLESGRSLPPGYSIKYGAKPVSNTLVQGAANQQASSIQTMSTSFHQSSQHTLTSQQNQHQLLTSHQVSNQQILSSHQQNISHNPLPPANNLPSILPQSNPPQPSIPQQVQLSANPDIVNPTTVSTVNRTRTPPWHQNKQSQERPPLTSSWAKKSKTPKDESPSFLDDPSGYLAQQTAMLRQAVAGREDEEPRTMASGHTASSNTLTSVLAGRTNTLTVSVGSQEPVKPPQQQQHILVSNNGQQFIIAAAPKVSPPSPLLLPAPLLLQPIDTVQLPQLVVPPVIHEDLVEKRKSPTKKRKMSPTTSTAMLLSPQPQQQVLTILPSKSPITNMIQPLNVVQNFPIQQFLVPSMVMPDGTILQSDTVQLNLLPSTGVFSSGQNLLAPAGVVLRAPTSQPQQQQTKFLHSPNQFVNFSGELSPQVVPNTSNTTVVQQNTTTIVQQTTMVQQPSPSYIVDKPFILTDKTTNFILSPSGSSTSSEKGAKSNGGPPPTSGSGFVRNSVSTQTQSQGVSVGGLMVSVASSPPDTTTLSPADAEVTTSVTSPSMVHCVSSTNLSDDSFNIDTTTPVTYSSGNLGKSVTYVESSTMPQPLQDKDITQINTVNSASAYSDCEDIHSFY